MDWGNNGLRGSQRAFTYPVSCTFTLDFSLWDADVGVTPVSGPLNRPDTQVTNGLFSVLLDISPEVFTGARLWLAVFVGGAALTPRQVLTAVPFALHSAGEAVRLLDRLASFDRGISASGNSGNSQSTNAGLVMGSANGSAYRRNENHDANKHVDADGTRRRCVDRAGDTIEPALEGE